MHLKHRPLAWIFAIAAAITVSLLAVVGCALDKNAGRSQGGPNHIGGRTGQIIEPRRCLLRVAILTRPFAEPVINDIIWQVADEQIVPPSQRRAWEANGLRVGRVIGELPPELDAILREASPQKRVNPSSFVIESGEQTLVSVSAPVPQASILLNRENRAFGKDFNDASGFLRVTVQHHGTDGVLLRLVPEIHHGPVQRMIQALPNAASLAPQEFRINDGQQEETLRDLPANLILEAGQVAVIGCRSEQKRTLGSFMFTQAEAHSDERHQKLILIWASRNLQGVIDGGPKATDRPKFFKRKPGEPAAQPTTRPASPVPLPGVPQEPTAPSDPNAPGSPGKPSATPSGIKGSGPSNPNVSGQDSQQP
jgi:hypothetical protein